MVRGAILLFGALALLTLSVGCGKRAHDPYGDRLIEGLPRLTTQLVFDSSARCAPTRAYSAPECQLIETRLRAISAEVTTKDPSVLSLRLAGIFAWRGLWFRHNPRAARQLLERACVERLDPISCAYLDALLIEESGELIRAEALESLTSRCVDEAPEACELLALGALPLSRAEHEKLDGDLSIYCDKPGHQGACLVSLDAMRRTKDKTSYNAREAALAARFKGDAASRARFLLFTQAADLGAISEIALRGNSTRQQQELMRGVALLQEILEDLGHVGATGVTPWETIASVMRARTLHIFATVLIQAEPPDGLSQPAITQWRGQIDSLIEPILGAAESISTPTLGAIFDASTVGYWSYIQLYDVWK